MFHRYAATGKCVAGACQYLDTYDACTEGCLQDVCHGPSGSGGGTGASGGGTAASGGATAASGGGTAASGGGTAASGGGTAACAGVSCQTPPASTCADAQHLKTFTAPGTCSNGTCGYGSQLVACANGCMNNQCVGEPCTGVVCATPPAATCISGTVRRGYASAGTCSGGTCSYAPQDTTCQFGCANGACVNDPCAGVTCSAPPAAYCLDATTRRAWSTPGTCAGGNCTYAPQDSTCQFGCANGLCSGNPCQGVVCNQPPAATCVGSNTRRTFAASGTCGNGSCTYAPSDTTCPFGCSSGACQADPCQGVTCGAPPSNLCVDATTARAYAPAGSCSGGTCGYPYVDTACPAGCTGGVCNAPSCGASACNAPPVATCVDAKTKKVFAPVGGCDAGSCQYAARSIWCSEGCFQGDCLPQSWTQEQLPFQSNDAWFSQDMQVDAAGEIHLVWVAQPSGQNGYDVFYARSSATGWTNEVLDPGLGQTAEVSLALGASGQAMVAYWDSINQDLRFAERVGGGFVKALVASTGSTGLHPSVAVDPSGAPAIAYLDGTAKELRLARRSGATWSTELVASGVNPASTGRTAVAFAPSGAAFVYGNDAQSGSLYRKTPGGVWTVFKNVPMTKFNILMRGEAPLVAGLAGNYSSGLKEWLYDGQLDREELIQIAGASGTGHTVLGPVNGYGGTLVLGTYLTGSTYTPKLLRRGDFGWSVLPRKAQYQGASIGALRTTVDGRPRLLVSWVPYNGPHYIDSAPACVPSCAGRTCGDDGCGGTCGTCASGQCAPNGTCTSWTVEDVCYPPNSDPPGASWGGVDTGFSLQVRSGAEMTAGVGPSGLVMSKRGGRWSGAQLPFDLPAGREHTVLLSDGGVAVLNDGTTGVIHAVYLQPDGGGVLMPVLDAGFESVYSSPRVSLSSTAGGTLTAVAPLALSSPYRAYVATSRFQGSAPQSRQSLQLIAQNVPNVQSLSTFTDPADVTHALWKQVVSLGAGQVAYQTRYANNASGSWDFAEAPDAGVIGNVQLFAGPGNAPAACVPVNGGVAYARRSGSAWSLEPIPNVAIATREEVVCRTSPSGTVVAVHASYGGALELLTRTGPGTWTTEVLPVAGTLEGVADVRFDPSGGLHVLYFEDTVNGNTSPYLRHFQR
ncbi:MAG: hypothetical protein K1X89_13635 [Myxococcaceae bacterium]|nr:hypothetical protein [Myxococcaceae bacterium]